jgi:DNA phosphorothioation-associated putative methyltransferase
MSHALQPDPSPIQRHRTAIRRTGFSLPVSCLLRDGLLDTSRSFFDYGCGHGQDLELLGGIGVAGEGWDPAHRPEVDRREAEVVNLGYVINVIEDPKERAEALRRAWSLARFLLVVAAQVEVVAPAAEHLQFADGVITTRNTFQKYYRQSELRTYLETTLAEEAVPAAPGVFYVFREEAARQEYLAARYRRAFAVPKVRLSERLFEEHRDILEPFMGALTRLGRLPDTSELPELPQIIERLGSAKRAFALVSRVTDAAPWKEIARRRAEDLLVYLALARFGKRPAFGQLPSGTQLDVKGFFGTYADACRQADAILFQAGQAEAIDAACQRAPVGRLIENALLLHRSALDSLEPLLRIYEGCARALLGEMEEANVIKLHRFSGKVSYLVFPDFERDPHPPLTQRVKVSLRSLDIAVVDHSRWGDPPILTRKETLLTKDDPLHSKFAALTRQEDRHGLLANPTAVQSSSALHRWLDLNGWTIRGHRLFRTTRPSITNA